MRHIWQRPTWRRRWCGDDQLQGVMGREYARVSGSRRAWQWHCLSTICRVCRGCTACDPARCCVGVGRPFGQSGGPLCRRAGSYRFLRSVWAAPRSFRVGADPVGTQDSVLRPEGLAEAARRLPVKASPRRWMRPLALCWVEFRSRCGRKGLRMTRSRPSWPSGGMIPLALRSRSSIARLAGARGLGAYAG